MALTGVITAAARRELGRSGAVEGAIWNAIRHAGQIGRDDIVEELFETLEHRMLSRQGGGLDR